MAQLTGNGSISRISGNVSLMLLSQIAATINYKPLLDSIIRPLVSREISLECKRAIEEFPESVRTFTKTWEFFEPKSDLDCTPSSKHRHHVKLQQKANTVPLP